MLNPLKHEDVFFRTSRRRKGIKKVILLEKKIPDLNTNLTNDYKKIRKAVHVWFH